MNESILKRNIRDKRLKLLKESKALRKVNSDNDLDIDKSIKIITLQNEKYKQYKFYDELIKRL